MILCPGQGAQSVGMGKAWLDASPAAKAIFDEADQILGMALSDVCFHGPEDQLNRTDVAQAAIYTTSVACYRGLEEQGRIREVIATAGLSLGEFTALHLAGAFDFASGLKLVRLRGQAMQDAADAADSGMVALMGADEEKATQLCDKARGDGVLVPANFNCPGQVVVSGSTDACERAAEAASEMGLRATPLKVAGAFHSPIMQPAADRLAEALEQTQWRSLEATVLANVTARPHVDDPNSIRELLVAQLTRPVRWSESMQWAAGNIDAELVELAPGRVLSGLMRKIDRQRKVTSWDEPA